MKWAAVFVSFLTLALTSNALVLKTSMSMQDYKSFAESALGSPEMKQLLGNGQRTIQINVGTDKIFVKASGGTVLNVGSAPSGSPDLTVSMSRDVALSISNSQDKGDTIRCFLSGGEITLSSGDLVLQGAIKAAFASGAIRPEPFGEGSAITIDGITATVKQGKVEWVAGQISSTFRVTIGRDDYLINKCRAPVGVLPRKYDLFSKPPAAAGIFFKKPPGILAQSPGLIYDTVSGNTNLVGPWNIFKINPGLVGPNQILALNPGLIGPLDIALLNPGLVGPRVFAYLLGIGAHSNTVNYLLNRSLVNDNIAGQKNYWIRARLVGGNYGG